METVVSRISIPFLTGALLTFMFVFHGSNSQKFMIDQSGIAIVYLRENYATKTTDFAMKIMSELGDKALLGGSVFFAVHWLGKIEALTVMSAFTLSTTSLGMLKLYFIEPRPFFLNPNIHPSTCKDLEYGFPSGHTTVTACTYLTLLFCISQKWAFLNESKVLQVLSVVLLACVLVVIGFSRLFLGVHSID